MTVTTTHSSLEIIDERTMENNGSDLGDSFSIRNSTNKEPTLNNHSHRNIFNSDVYLLDNDDYSQKEKEKKCSYCQTNLKKYSINMNTYILCCKKCNFPLDQTNIEEFIYDVSTEDNEGKKAVTVLNHVQNDMMMIDATSGLEAKPMPKKGHTLMSLDDWFNATGTKEKNILPQTSDLDAHHNKVTNHPSDDDADGLLNFDELLDFDEMIEE